MNGSRDAGRTTPVLNSWKEIAAYVGRGVRTLQRYERLFGFPIRRPNNGKHSSVMALPEEIDEWLQRTARRAPAPNGQQHDRTRALRDVLEARIKRLDSNARKLQEKAEQLRIAAEQLQRRRNEPGM